MKNHVPLMDMAPERNLSMVTSKLCTLGKKYFNLDGRFPMDSSGRNVSQVCKCMSLLPILLWNSYLLIRTA